MLAAMLSGINDLSIYPPFAPPSQGGRSLRAAVVFSFRFGLCLAAGAQLLDLLSGGHPRGQLFYSVSGLGFTLPRAHWGALGRSGVVRGALGRSGL